MEGPLEIKDSTVVSEEPIKSEAPVQSPDSSDRSDGAASPPPNCSICLGKLVNTSFTDSCLHQFCFTCLLQWSKIKTECPLCKQTFKSIIHNVRSEEDYDQYHVPRELASQISQPQLVSSLDLNFDVNSHWDVGLRRFLYRTTMTGNRRHGVLLNAELVARREQLPSIAPQVSREERRRRRANPTDYRRTVYRHGIWATSLPDIFGRFRECSADYYRREPRELNRLVPWLNRELQVLLNSNVPHIAYVMRVILDALSQYDIRSPEFRDLVRPYFGVHTDHFVHELLNYARTNFDLVGYDQSVTYLPQGLSNEYVPNVVSTSSDSSTTSDDSDIRVLDEAIDLRVNTEVPGVGPHPISMPGPSTVGQAFQLDRPYNVPDILTISSNSSTSDDECEVIGYVKPRHERTPEIIDIISSDPEEVNTAHVSSNNAGSSLPTFFGDCAQPSTSHSTKKRSSSLSTDSSDTDSDSDYDPRKSKRYQSHGKKSSKRNTTVRRRKRSSDVRSRNRGSRNLSSSGESDARKRVSKKSAQHRIKKRLSSSSDSSSQDVEGKKVENKKSRSNRYSTRGTVRVRKDLIKRESRYAEDDSSSSSSSSNSSDTDQNAKCGKSRAQRRSKRKYMSSSSDFEGGRGGRVTRTRVKARQCTESDASDGVASSKERRYKESSRQARSRSSSSSYASQTEKRSSARRRESQREEHESKLKIKKIIESSSESEKDQCRTSSQCSNHSSKSYVHRKRSKHKGRHKSKDRKRSVSSTCNSSQSISSTSNSTISSSASSKADSHSTSKHSDSKNGSGSKERHKSYKNHKESKHGRSQSEAKSKSKKKRRRVRTSSSNSD
ncbi:hypothetical protein KM043_011930 [Ampulex compressa]|nr:hypothetical protein KM043_011930 [Ampulex compressa]